MQKIIFISRTILFVVAMTAISNVSAANHQARKTTPEIMNDAIWVNMVSLLGSPDKYDGKLIRVQGYLSLREESEALYLHKEDFQAMLPNLCLLRVSFQEIAQYRALDQQYVTIVGEFSAKGPARAMGFGGQIAHIVLIKKILND